VTFSEIEWPQKEILMAYVSNYGEHYPLKYPFWELYRKINYKKGNFDGLYKQVM
jgi:hypothetical protein